MDRTEKRALVLALIDALGASGSWCGETHIQKSCYVLQTKFGLPTDFVFTMYKHGPFSFGLQEYLHELRGSGLLDAWATIPYGTRLMTTGQGKQIASLRKDLIDRFKGQLKAVSNHLGKKNVRDLEKITTAVYVIEELGENANTGDYTRRIIKYKKHVTPDEALQAIKEAQAITA